MSRPQVPCGIIRPHELILPRRQCSSSEALCVRLFLGGTFHNHIRPTAFLHTGHESPKFLYPSLCFLKMNLKNANYLLEL